MVSPNTAVLTAEQRKVFDQLKAHLLARNDSIVLDFALQAGMEKAAILFPVQTPVTQLPAHQVSLANQVYKLEAARQQAAMDKRQLFDLDEHVARQKQMINAMQSQLPPTSQIEYRPSSDSLSMVSTSSSPPQGDQRRAVAVSRGTARGSRSRGARANYAGVRRNTTDGTAKKQSGIGITAETYDSGDNSPNRSEIRDIPVAQVLPISSMRIPTTLPNESPTAAKSPPFVATSELSAPLMASKLATSVAKQGLTRTSSAPRQADVFEWAPPEKISSISTSLHPAAMVVSPTSDVGRSFNMLTVESDSASHASDVANLQSFCEDWSPSASAPKSASPGLRRANDGNVADVPSTASTRPFKCGFCAASFTTRQILQTHKKSHAGVRFYSCDLCSRTFPSRQKHRYHHLSQRTGPIIKLYKNMKSQEMITTAAVTKELLLPSPATKV